MSNEELVGKIRSGEDVEKNIEQLYLQNRGLIGSIASHYAGQEDLEDLKQEGFFGLMTALELWSPDGGASFSTYAFKWIRQAIKRYIENSGSLIRLPVHQIERIYKYNQELESFRRSFMRDPSSQELAFYLGVTSEEIEELKRDYQYLNLRSTDEAIRDKESLTLGDTIRDEKDMIDDVIEDIQREELSRLLWSLVDTLKDNESEILRKRYKEGLTLKTCGDQLGISGERARQIEKQAIRKMKRPSIRQQLEPYLEERALAIAQRSIGLKSFRRTWTSAPEMAILFLESKQETLQSVENSF